jgi:hypothetical protein
MNVYPAPVFDATAFFGMLALVAVVLPWAAWVFSPAVDGGTGNSNSDSDSQSHSKTSRLAHSWAVMRWMLAVAAISAALAASGVLARIDLQPPALVVLVLATQALLWWHALGPRGAAVARGLAVPAAVLLQSFRLPLELLMLHAAQVGLMPLEFSMAGYNFDVATGAAALPVAWWAWRVGLQVGMQAGGRQHPFTGALLWAWNLWGIACLVVIVGLALATSPKLALFGASPQHLSLWVLHFPYVWLPVLLVGVATYGHLVLTRRLLMAWPAAAGAPQAPPHNGLRFPFTSRNGTL